jgi:hypothetical protein
METVPPNVAPEPTAVGAGRSVVAVPAASRGCFSFPRYAPPMAPD